MTYPLRPRPKRREPRRAGAFTLCWRSVTSMPASDPKTYCVYITASAQRGTIYTGMTSDLAGRAWEHRTRVIEGFTKKYWTQRLVYYEGHDDAETAARRERAVKRWRRDWKIELIE